MYKQFLCILFLSGCVRCSEWQEALNVHSYYSFRSGTLLKFDVPTGTSLVTWNFRASRIQDYCDHQQVDVYVHYGSLPVINPLNETFPENFYLDRIPNQYLQLTSDNISIPVQVSWPTPGPWYSIAFRPEQDSRIQQKGLYAECHYKISTSFSVEKALDIEHIALNTDISINIPDNGKNLRFYVGPRVWQYAIHLSQCNLSDCDLQVSIPNTSNITSNTSVCGTPPCVYTVTSPWLEAWHYIHLVSPSGPVQVIFNISTTDCNIEENDSFPNSTDTSVCQMYPKLDRYRSSNQDFLGDFVYIVNETKPADIAVYLTPNVTTIVPFQLRDMIDTGGSLKWTVEIDTKGISATEHIQICGQIQYGKLPTVNLNTMTPCNTSSLSSNQVQVNSSSTDHTSQVYVPYPESGQWALSLTTHCYTLDTDTGSYTWTECTNSSYRVTMQLTTDRCVDNGCSGHGQCKEYIVGPSLIVYSVCNCVSGWRGYACSDGSKAFSVSLQLEDLLLLTLSNLFFIPTIVLAIYRRYYTEAIVYIYNMFFSAMYHACDGDRINMYKYCMTDYNILSFCDFLSSVCSLWFTLVAMAKLHGPITSALQVTALLVLPIGVLKEHTSLWLIVVPLACGVVVVAVAWSLQCRSRHSCYPSRKRYLLCLLPGVATAVTGASVFAFAETIDNYRYVHSTWHMCLFLSVLFLLPSGRRKGLSIKHSESADSIQGLMLQNRDS